MKVARSTVSADATLFLIVVPVFAFLDVLGPLAFEDSYRIWRHLPGFLAGIVAGQWALIAAWSVFGPGRWLVRWPAMLALAVTLYVIGVTAMAAPNDNEQMLTRGYTAGLFLPLLMLCSQSGMWVMKIATGWQIVDSGNALLGKVRKVQFTLAHLLAATTMIAASFGLAQLALSIFSRLDRESGFVPPGWNDLMYWIPVLIMALSFGIYGTLIVAPLLWSVMRPSNAWLRVAFVVGCLTFATLALFGVFVVPILFSSTAMFGVLFLLDMLAALAVFHVGFAAVFVGALLLARVFDLRLFSARHLSTTEPQPKTID